MLGSLSYSIARRPEEFKSYVRAHLSRHRQIQSMGEGALNLEVSEKVRPLIDLIETNEHKFTSTLTTTWIDDETTNDFDGYQLLISVPNLFNQRFLLYVLEIVDSSVLVEMINILCRDSHTFTVSLHSNHVYNQLELASQFGSNNFNLTFTLIGPGKKMSIDPSVLTCVEAECPLASFVTVLTPSRFINLYTFVFCWQTL